MAERRMFAKTIIDSDAFLDMPLSTQSLYFHLSMRADDDGFINNPKKIQRVIGASEDDLRILIGKRFIIPFESGIVVIKHWKIHNYIQKDRYKETVYKEEKSLLKTKDNQAYTLDTSCIHDVYSMETQDRIGKDSIGNDNNIVHQTQALLECDTSVTNSNESKSKSKSKNNNIVQSPVVKDDYKSEFEDLWSMYPKKRGNKTTAFNAYVKARKEGVTKADVLIGINNYKAHIKTHHIDPQYILNGQTYFSGKRWNDDYSIRKQEQTQEHYNDKNQFNHFPQHEYDWKKLEHDLLGRGDMKS